MIEKQHENETLVMECFGEREVAYAEEAYKDLETIDVPMRDGYETIDEFLREQGMAISDLSDTTFDSSSSKIGDNLERAMTLRECGKYFPDLNKKRKLAKLDSPTK